MGKSKRRSKASRMLVDPLRKRNKESIKDEAMSLKKIQPLLKQLQSAAANDRSMALSSITVLCEDPYMRKLFLKEKLVHLILSNSLSDDNMEIVVESYGLLRNLALEEGYDVCVFLWRSDIWTSITGGFTKLLGSLESLAANIKASAESTRSLFDFGDNLLSLLVALTNGSDDILKDFLSSDKLAQTFAVLHKVLTFALSEHEGQVSLKIPISFFNTILDFVYDLSSESMDFIEAASQDSYLSEFIKAVPTLQLPSANVLTEVLSQGIYLQFLDLDVTPQQVNEIITRACKAISGIDLEELKKNISNADVDKELVSAPDKEVSRRIKEINKKRAQALIELQSIEVTLDIITASLEIIAAKSENNKMQLDDSLLQTLTVSLPLVFTSLFSDFRARILIAWNNMLWLYLTIQINLFELPNGLWQQLWTTLSNETPAEQADFGLRLGKLGVMWALLKTLQLQDNNSTYLEVLGCDNAGFVDAIKAEYGNTQDIEQDEAQELRQRCCGILACLAVLPNHVELNQHIGRFFLERLADDQTPAATLIDISDLLFDVYCDANYDYDEPVFVAGGFVNILKSQVISNMRKTFKFVDKNRDPKLKERAQDCFNTMERFIQYKLDERT